MASHGRLSVPRVAEWTTSGTTLFHCVSQVESKCAGGSAVVCGRRIQPFATTQNGLNLHFDLPFLSDVSGNGSEIRVGMRRRETISQVKSGLLLTALVLFCLFMAGLFFAGINFAFFPDGHSRILGLIFLAVSVPVMFITVDRWVKALASLMGFAVLNGLITMWSGNVLGNPTQPMPRLEAMYLTLYSAAALALSAPLRKGRMSLVVRISAMAFAFSVACLLSYNGALESRGHAHLDVTDFILMGISLSCLLVAWSDHHFRSRNGRSVNGEMA
jgi:hypothetical protein